MTVTSEHLALDSRPETRAFPEPEYRQRLAAVQRRIRDRGLDLLLVHTPENLCYLTGYQTSGYFAYQALAVPASGDPRLLVRFVERRNVDEHSWLPSALTWRDGDDLGAATAELVAEFGTVATIGVERHSWFLTVAAHEDLRRALHPSRLVDAGRLVEAERIVKSPAEVEQMRAAARLADIALLAAVEAAQPGARELDVAAAAHDAQIRAGAEYPALPHYVAAGYRGDIGHANWTSKRLEPGEILHLEFLGCANRYHAGVMRPVAIGAATGRQRHEAELCIQAQDDALAQMRPGVPARLIDRLARERLHAAGRPDDRVRSGYSIGIGFPPTAGESSTLDLNAASEWTLAAGMTFHMLSLMTCGIGFSETVHVTATGCERLTRAPRELFVRSESG